MNRLMLCPFGTYGVSVLHLFSFFFVFFKPADESGIAVLKSEKKVNERRDGRNEREGRMQQCVDCVLCGCVRSRGCSCTANGTLKNACVAPKWQASEMLCNRRNHVSFFKKKKTKNISLKTAAVLD